MWEFIGPRDERGDPFYLYCVNIEPQQIYPTLDVALKLNKWQWDFYPYVIPYNHIYSHVFKCLTLCWSMSHCLRSPTFFARSIYVKDGEGANAHFVTHGFNTPMYLWYWMRKKLDDLLAVLAPSVHFPSLRVKGSDDR